MQSLLQKVMLRIFSGFPADKLCYGLRRFTDNFLKCMEHLPVLKPGEQFSLFEQMIRVFGLSKLSLLLSEGLVDQYPARREGISDGGDERTVQVAKDDDRRECPARERIGSFRLEVYVPKGNCSVFSICPSLYFFKRFFRPVCKDDPKPPLRQKDSVVAVAAREIKDGVLLQFRREEGQMIPKKAVRFIAYPEVCHEGYPSATSRIIITVKPMSAPNVAISEFFSCCDSGISSSTTTKIMAPAAKASA